MNQVPGTGKVPRRSDADGVRYLGTGPDVVCSLTAVGHFFPGSRVSDSADADARWVRTGPGVVSCSRTGQVPGTCDGDDVHWPGTDRDVVAQFCPDVSDVVVRWKASLMTDAVLTPARRRGTQTFRRHRCLGCPRHPALSSSEPTLTYNQ